MQILLQCIISGKRQSEKELCSLVVYVFKKVSSTLKIHFLVFYFQPFLISRTANE